MASKFYVTETEYVGPNEDYADRDWFDISTEPARFNCSHEINLDGWCGTTNDHALYAYGEFETLEQARHFVEEKLEGKFREEHDLSGCYGDVLARYKVGKYVPFSPRDTYEWARSTLSDISSDMTDDQIRLLADEVESAANSEIGATLDRRRLEKMFFEQRDELKYLEEDNSMELG